MALMLGSGMNSMEALAGSKRVARPNCSFPLE